MLKTLVAVRFQALISAFFRGRKKNQTVGAGRKILLGLIGVYLIAVYAGLFGLMFYGLCGPFKMMNLSALYFALAAFMSLTLSFAGSVFATQSQLYDANDNELLLSMPVQPWMILLSRMIVLYLTNLLFTALVMLPAGVVFWWGQAPTFGGVAAFVLGTLLLPLGSLTLSCLFGWLFAWIGSHMRNKSIVSLLVTVAFFAAYFFFISKSDEVPQMLINNADKVAGFIRTAGWRAWQLGQGIMGNAGAFAQFVLAVLVPFLLVLYVLARSFIGIATRNKGGVKIEYHRRAMTVRGVRQALLMKDLSHFVSSAAWMLNGGMGLLFMLVGPAMVLSKAEFIRPLLAEVPEVSRYVMLLLALFECLTLSMVPISAASVSIEGKSLWLMQAMPVDGKDVLVSKALLQFVITLPFLAVATVLTWLCGGGNVGMYLIALILPLTFAAMMSLLGPALNVRFPRLDWASEAIAVKQGLSVALDMGVGMALLATPVVLWAIWLNRWISPEVYALLMSALYILLSALLYRYLGRGGKKRLETL